MHAHDLFLSGRLGEALREQGELVRDDPGNADARWLLFVLLCFAGEFERARRALDVIATQAAQPELHSALLRSLLAAEAERTRVWHVGGEPMLGDDPPAHARARIRALVAARAHDLDGLEKALDEAALAAPTCRGTLDGTSFEAVRDEDDVLGSVLEVFAGGRYLWLPLEDIHSLEIAAPTRAIDLLWAPATLETRDRLRASVFVPVLYEGSATHRDDSLALGRTTAWTDLGRSIHRGAGQRVLRSMQGDTDREWPLLELRRWTSAPAATP